jgi:hypothetical protein
LSEARLHGLLAEFEGAAPLIAAARSLRQAGFRRLESYTPIPLDELDDLIAGRRTRLPLSMLACGLAGFLGFFLLQSWAAAIDYPINIGGRPLLSWPAFLPSSLEVGLLAAVAGGFVLFFVLDRMPRLHHPIDAAPGFERASQDGFFLCVEAADPHFERERVRAALERCRAIRILEVAP